MLRWVFTIAIPVTMLCVLAAWFYAHSRPRMAEIACMAVDGPKVAVGLKDGTVVGLLLENGAFREERRIAHCSGNWLNALSYTSKHDLVCSGEKLRTLNGGGTLLELRIPSAVSGGAFGSTAEFRGSLAVITATENILLIDAYGRIQTQIGAHTALYGDLKASQDGKFLAASGHTPRVWSSDFLEERKLAHSNYAFGPAAFSASRVYMGNQDGCVYEWSIGDWSEWPRFCRNSGAISQIDVSRDGRQLAMAGREVTVLEAETARLVGRIPREAHAGLAFLDNSKLLTATGSRVELWECKEQICAPKAAMNVAP